MDLPTFRDLFRAGRNEALRRNAKLAADVFDREGTDANILGAFGAAVGDEVVFQIARGLAASFLDSAENTDLDRLLFDRYGLVRKQAAAAIGSVQFRTTAAAAAAFTIPAGALLGTIDGAQFLVTQTTTYPLGSTGPVTVAVRSVLAGGNQQAKAATITSILTTIAGAPVDLTVTNTLATAGAADEEKDEEFRGRGRSYFRNARRGTLGAIESAALAVPGVVRASAIEVLDVSGRPAREVMLIVADQFTDALAELDVVPPTYQTQSQLLAQVVFAGLAEWRAGGIYVDVKVAQLVLQTFHLALRFFAGANVDRAAVEARAAIVGAVNALNPGASMVPSEIVKVLRSVPGIFYSGDEILSPAGSVVPKPLQVIRTNLGLVTAAAVALTTPLATSTNPDAFTEV